MATKDKKRGTWSADVMIKGKRYRKRGFSEKRFAEIWEAQKRYEAERIGVGVSQEQEFKRLDDLFSSYKKWMFAQKFSSSYKEGEEDRMKCLLLFFEQSAWYTVGDVTSNILEKYKAWRGSQITHLREFVSSSTINQELSFIVRAFKRLVRIGELRELPFSACYDSLRVEEKEVSFLSEEEVEKLLAAFTCKKGRKNDSLRDAIIVFLGTGLRLGELTSLRVKNCNLEKRTILLEAKNTKKRYARVIPLQPKAFEVIERKCKEVDKSTGERKAGESFVFTGMNGGQLNKRSMQSSFKRWLLKSGIEGEYTIHDLRRTYISHMIMAGVEPVKVMGIVGHKSFSAMKPYLFLAPDYLGAGLDVLPF